MAKKKRNERQDRPGGQEPQSGSPAPQAAGTVAPATPPIDEKFYTWQWYAKVYGVCLLISGLAFLAFVYKMKSISRGYTEDGIAMYKMAKELQKQDKRDMDVIAGELAALDALVDIEKLKSFLLSDVAYKPLVTEDTKAYLREEAEKYSEVVQHLREVGATDPVLKEIRDKTVGKIENIRESLAEVIRICDVPDADERKRKVIKLDKKISELGWYSMIAAGFSSWPAALDAAERSFFEALRFWQKNPEATYWWGRVLEETAINDVAAEKKIMAIRFDPNSKLADEILDEFRKAYEANPDNARSAYNYAFALYRKGRRNDAMPLLRKVYERDPKLTTFEAFLAKRRIDIIERKIDMTWSKTDDF